ncbi:MAG: Rne/Rng family ribonuclease, partial [Planctomycetota bacterium]|nr:Rne/Rng family ribonuclease [Planctomycetota bacterium]
PHRHNLATVFYAMSIVLINAREAAEIRTVTLSNGKVVSFHYVRLTGSDFRTGNIYLGKIVSIERGLAAAFVDIGSDKHAFLPLSNIPSEKTERERDSEQNEKKHRKMGFRKTRVGQSILVQIVREAVENKGAQLTGFIAIPGRYLVLSPFERGVRVSRKIEEEEERERLRKMVSDIAPPNFAFIVRTAAQGARKLDIAKDTEYLLRLYKRIDDTVKKSSPPSLMYSDTDFATRVVREILSPDVEEIIVDEEEQFKRLEELLKVTMPRFLKSLKLYDSLRPLFDSYGVEEQVKTLQEREVPLPSGGRIIIEQTEALVSIDVNSGSTKGSDTEETSYQTNIEAVEEIARQLQLRDLGGLIVIDLIDMKSKERRSAVERKFRAMMRSDRAKLTLLPTNRLGLLILSRQKLRPSLLELTTTPCDRCNGAKRVTAPLTSAAKALRKLQSYLASNPSERVKLVLPANVTEALFNEMRKTLLTIEQRFKTKIYLVPDSGSEKIPVDGFEILPA